jgi:hypothetical protein
MKNIYHLLFSLIILSSCSNENNMNCIIYLPSNKSIEACTVKELNQKYELKYKQYEGYTGKLEDSIISDFNVYLKEEPDFVKSGNADKNEIESLLSHPIVGLRSQKLPKENYTEEELNTYIKNNFNSSSEKVVSTQEEFIDREIHFFNSNSKLVAKLQYAEVGIPGYFIFMPVVKE